MIMTHNPEHILLAAQGYYELGMVGDALREIDLLSPAWKSKPEVIELRLLALMQVHAWSEALDAGFQLCEAMPDACAGFIHAAFCLHEMQRTEEAKQLLLKGPSSLHREPVFFYNLACYDARLGNRDEALEHLQRSFKLDKKFKDFARQDPDLANLRDALE